jgi:hypothetical protein
MATSLRDRPQALGVPVVAVMEGQVAPLEMAARGTRQLPPHRKETTAATAQQATAKRVGEAAQAQ